MNKKIHEQVLKEVEKKSLNYPQNVEQAISQTIELMEEDYGKLKTEFGNQTRMRDKAIDEYCIEIFDFKVRLKHQKADFRKMIEMIKDRIAHKVEYKHGLLEFIDEEILAKLNDNHSQLSRESVRENKEDLQSEVTRSSVSAPADTSKGCEEWYSEEIEKNVSEPAKCGVHGLCKSCKKETGTDTCAKCGYFRVAHNDKTFWDKKNVCKNFQEVGG